MDARTVTTADDLLGLSEPGYRFELVRGELRRKTGAGHWHGAVTNLLTEFLARHVRTNGLGLTYAAETGFLLARLVWVVDPWQRTVTVFRARDAIRSLRGDDVLDGEDVVPGFAARVAELFPAPVPPKG
ncbi:MAG: Uma2 family endonuclease [Planctomycetes bacterium]|nr:Uma2 family endonuclease [Planctomycetota bacterium]